MSEGLLVALIGVIGSIVGAIIGGIVQRGSSPIGFKWMLLLGSLGGLLLGLFVGLIVASRGAPNSVVQATAPPILNISNSPTSVTSSQNSGTIAVTPSIPTVANIPTYTPIIITPTFIPSLSPTQNLTLMPTLETDEPQPTAISAPALVAGQFVDDFDVSLEDDWGILDPGLFVTNGEAKGKGYIFYKPEYNDYKIIVRVKQSFQVLFRAEAAKSDHGLPYRAYGFRCQSSCIWDKSAERDDGSVWGGSISDFVELPYKDEEFHTITIIVSDKKFTAYIDGNPFSSAADEEYKDGLVVLSGGPFDSFSIEPIAQDEPQPTAISAPVLVAGQFVDNFDVSLEDDWGILDPGLFVTNGEAKGEGYIFYKPEYNNYKIIFRAKNFFRVLFRAKDAKNDHGLPYRAYGFRCESSCIWDKTAERDDGSVWGGSISDFVELPYKDEEFHTITIIVSDKKFTAYIDGNPFSSAADEEYKDGLVVLSGGPFDSFSIEPIAQ